MLLNPPPAAAENAPGPPTKIDFMFAQVRQIHSVTGVGDNGMVHCNRFRSYRAYRTEDPSKYRVAYREYRAKGPWPKLTAVLKRDGDNWTWVEGDLPKCSIWVFE